MSSVIFFLLFMLQPRQNLINAASKVGDASHDIMYHVEPDSELDSAYKVNTCVCRCSSGSQSNQSV